MIDGYLSDEPLAPSFILGRIENVHANNHSVDIQPFRYTEMIIDVPVFRDPGSTSLPQKGDIALIIFDDRGQPAVIGVYPYFIKDGIIDKKDYPVKEGQVCIQAIHSKKSKAGGKLLILNTGGNNIIKLENPIDQGIELDENNGSLTLRSPSKKEETHDVVEKSGYIRRKSILNTGTLFNLNNQDDILRKIGSINAPGLITSTDFTGVELAEKRTEIRAPGAPGLLGLNIYEETVGTSVVGNDAIGGVYSEKLHSQTALPLRKKTVFYDSTGLVELLTEEVDSLGNLHIYISSAATSGVKIDALVPVIANFLSLNITTTGNIDLTAPFINLNGGTDFVALANLLVLAFNSHTHAGVTTGPGTSGVPIVPWIPTMIGSATVKSS